MNLNAKLLIAGNLLLLGLGVQAQTSIYSPNAQIGATTTPSNGFVGIGPSTNPATHLDVNTLGSNVQLKLSSVLTSGARTSAINFNGTYDLTQNISTACGAGGISLKNSSNSFGLHMYSNRAIFSTNPAFGNGCTTTPGVSGSYKFDGTIGTTSLVVSAASASPYYSLPSGYILAANGNTLVTGSSQINGKLGIGVIGTLTGRLETNSSGNLSDAVKLRMSTTGTTLNSNNTVLALFNDNNTANNYARINFASKNSSNTEIIFASLGAQYLNRTAGAESADLIFSTRTNGTEAEQMRITAAGLVHTNNQTSSKSTLGVTPSTIASFSIPDPLAILAVNGNAYIKNEIRTDGRIGIGKKAETPLDVISNSFFGNEVKFRINSNATTLTGINTAFSIHNDDQTINNVVRMHFAGKMSDNSETNFTSIGTQYRSRTVGQETGDLLFATSNAGNDTEKMRITAEGKVLIGLDGTNKNLLGDANARLGVNGSIYATGLVIRNVSNFPDYVFEKDYQLRSLTEVEKFIAEHKHLPEVPSANEVEQQGMDAAEMNKVLLKKVEELTLYMIELQKQVDALKSTSR